METALKLAEASTDPQVTALLPMIRKRLGSLDEVEGAMGRFGSGSAGRRSARASSHADRNARRARHDEFDDDDYHEDDFDDDEPFTFDVAAPPGRRRAGGSPREGQEEEPPEEVTRPMNDPL